MKLTQFLPALVSLILGIFPRPPFLHPCILSTVSITPTLLCDHRARSSFHYRLAISLNIPVDIFISPSCHAPPLLCTNRVPPTSLHHCLFTNDQFLPHVLPDVSLVPSSPSFASILLSLTGPLRTSHEESIVAPPSVVLVSREGGG